MGCQWVVIFSDTKDCDHCKSNQIKSNHAFIIIYKGNMRGYL